MYRHRSHLIRSWAMNICHESVEHLMKLPLSHSWHCTPPFMTKHPFKNIWQSFLAVLKSIFT